MAQVALYLLALGVAAPAAGQTGTAARIWTAVSIYGQLSGGSPWRWTVDSLVRTRDGARTMDFAAGWMSVSRRLTRRSSVGVGYAYGAAFPDAGAFREHRFVQQYTWGAGATWRLSFRSRLEERLVKGRDGVLIRTRQQIRATWPLADGGPVRGVVSEEVFVKANSTAWAARGFDANRVFVGLGWNVTPQSGVEVGYVHVYSPGASKDSRHSHVMSATLVLSR